MHKISVLAMHGFVPFDLSIPCEVFGRAYLAGGAPAYEVRVCGESSEVRSSAFNLLTSVGLDALIEANTVIIPGVDNTTEPVSDAVLVAIRAAWMNGARLATICSGSLVLAATGLLDGRRATTHWACAAELARRFPAVSVDAKVLYVDEGRIITSAGASAGLDMCLHLVRKDHGQSVASEAARMAVAPLNRGGGQAQFIKYEPPVSQSSLAPLLSWMRENAHLPLNIPTLAVRAHLSTRTFSRRFREQTGTTPTQWLLLARVARAQELLETTSASIEQIATSSGFETSVSFRTHFHRTVGVSPRDYRKQRKLL